MKPSFIFSIIALVAIVVAASFSIQMSPHNPIVIPESVAGSELYVCHAASQTWDSIAVAMRPFNRYIIIGFFFVVMILLFNWGWAMYQNLLNDKFKRESFSNIWKFTKFTFWAGVIILMVSATPNHFRTVHIRGVGGDWVLCENNTPGAAAVRADAVTM